MHDWTLLHLNVVRPIGPFSISNPNAAYFLREMPKVFEAARADAGVKFHDHGVRWPDGHYSGFDEVADLQTTQTEDNPYILTMAGWRSFDDLHRFAYREPLHREGMETLRDWVYRSEGPTMVMWWLPAGAKATLDDAWQRLEKLRRDGATPEAFSLQKRFDPPS